MYMYEHCNVVWIFFSQAKSITEPFAYEDYRRNKIREKIEEERSNRVKLQVHNWKYQVFKFNHMVDFC